MSQKHWGEHLLTRVVTCLSCRLDAFWLPHHGPPGFSEGDVRCEAYANYWSLGSHPWAGTQSTAAGMGVSPSHHRGHMQPLVCLCSWGGAGHSQASGPPGTQAPVSEGEDKRLSEERCSAKGLERVDCSGDIPAGNREKCVCVLSAVTEACVRGMPAAWWL